MKPEGVERLIVISSSDAVKTFHFCFGDTGKKNLYVNAYMAILYVI